MCQVWRVTLCWYSPKCHSVPATLSNCELTLVCHKHFGSLVNCSKLRVRCCNAGSMIRDNYERIRTCDLRVSVLIRGYKKGSRLGNLRISGPTYCLTSCSSVVIVLVCQPSGPGSILAFSLKSALSLTLY